MRREKKNKTKVRKNAHFQKKSDVFKMVLITLIGKAFETSPKISLQKNIGFPPKRLMRLMELRMTSQKLGLGICLIALLTIGCSTTSVKWYKPGVSNATFSRDKSECEDALLSTGTTQRIKGVYSLEGCLEAKGYRAVPNAPQ